MSGRQTTFCGSIHYTEFYTKYIWDFVTRALIEEKGCCEKCEVTQAELTKRYHELMDIWRKKGGSEPPGHPHLQVHHKKPISSGGDPFEKSNLQVLCTTCHGKAHSKLKGTRKPKKKATLAFDQI